MPASSPDDQNDPPTPPPFPSHRRLLPWCARAGATRLPVWTGPALRDRPVRGVRTRPLGENRAVTQTPAPAVVVRGLHVRFGDVEAVAGVDLTAEAGQATALLGRNGAGKSTTMKVLAGVVPPTAGEVTVAGHDAATDALGVKRSVGYCPDVGGLVPRATPWEHLQLSARLRRMPAWEERGRDLLERFELGDVAHRVVGGFSHGMSRRLSVVLASLHDPAVLLLDEPFDGVDPLGVDATLEVVADARARGACVLLSTHLRDLALEACGEAVVLRGGNRVAAMQAGELTGEAYRALLD
ncbi:ABC transporter ATP-binding protein [Nocardioides ganghwensis]|uniref:ABC transporter ATP-binding protein n=1 Tax=Nocardioides ganghwensis TaxID=252230 RepID=A0A4Q2SM07_9ACTN|nr:ABC transporter ATP-binding protein [Nocardioides ganghwensis]RYC05079.1 ABC transporter ATP-binding protein [Nocardioides ganghwensis]